MLFRRRPWRPRVRRRWVPTVVAASGNFNASCTETLGIAESGSATNSGLFAARAESIAIAEAAAARYGRVTTPPLKNNDGMLLANLTGVTVDVYRISTGALVVRKTGLTTDAAGIAIIEDQSISAGSSDYKYDPDLTSTNLGNLGRRLPVATAT